MPPGAVQTSSLTRSGLTIRSINLDRSIDRPHEDEGGTEADCSRDEGEGVGNHEHVAEVDQCTHIVANLHSSAVKQDRVHEHVDSRKCTCEERSPVPGVVLIGELEVGDGDRNFCTRYHQDDKNKHQEPEEVVELVVPDGRHDEEKLRKDSSER
eukprot:CAMPEP_0194752366 /NCGR_PEP_ID=MMETSP0323_2-20130528/6130_1 /TAXON_ID=2866 ORGANISM="Crypthecodinium cohnii, Strain Seligo" /NCGR_SAMPLE_ID=MMETSP0323_2 /ASSEMBLY_ACC=CAM_ASM_000346 /LENGTH=153 /DNA_ID=CAMNT_0039669205 /DNA_START=303 /DNA_END=764 /DNA_ORIENTATION=+